MKFHHSKLNFKWAQGGAEVKWHQDIQFWPHTNYSPLTVGTYLYDCGMEQGPLGVLPGSHRGPMLTTSTTTTALDRVPVGRATSPRSTLAKPCTCPAPPAR